MKALEEFLDKTSKLNLQWKDLSLTEELIQTTNFLGVVKCRQKEEDNTNYVANCMHSTNVYEGSSKRVKASAVSLNEIKKEKIPQNVCPVKISKNDTLGRFLISTRKIEAGEVLLVERSLAHGPVVRFPLRKMTPRCIHCFLTSNSFICPICGFYVCRNPCVTFHCNKKECLFLARLNLTAEQQHIHKMEVKNFRDMLMRLPEDERLSTLRVIGNAYLSLVQDQKCHIMRYYPALATFKTLMNISKSKSIRSFIASLQSGCDPLSKRYKFNEKWIVEPIIKLGMENDRNWIHHIAGIWDTNAFEVSIEGLLYQAVYPLSSLLTHSCVPNCEQMFTKNGIIVMRAVEDILPNTILTLCYSDHLWPNYIRRYHLLKTKNFVCVCPRCVDDTELGSKIGHIRCQHCGQLSIHYSFACGLQCFAECDHCNKTFEAKELLKEESRASAVIKQLPLKTVKHYDDILKTLSSLAANRYHDKHHLIQRLRITFLANISKDPTLTGFSLEDLHCLEAVATDALAFYSIVLPRLSIHKARVVEELIRFRQEICLRTGNILHDYEVIKPLIEDAKLVLNWDHRERQITVQPNLLP